MRRCAASSLAARFCCWRWRSARRSLRASRGGKAGRASTIARHARRRRTSQTRRAGRRQVAPAASAATPRTDEPTMHATPAVRLGCTDCHGGDATRDRRPELGFTTTRPMSPRATGRMCCRAIPRAGTIPSSANPKRSYTLLNQEAPEFVRFVNPGDYRVAREACGACHLEIDRGGRALADGDRARCCGAAAAYNNGIVPFKNYMLRRGLYARRRAGEDRLARRRRRAR